MTSYKLKLNQIREVLGMPVKLEKATLANGTVVEVEKLEIGFPVSIVAEDGSLKPAPEGEHILDNGTKIKVDANGVIAEIVAADAVPVAAEEEEEKPINEIQRMELPEGVAEVISAIIEEKMVKEEEKMAKKAEETMKMIYAALEEVAKEVSMVKEEMKDMKTKMQKFAKTPAGSPVPKLTLEKSGEYDAIDARIAHINEIKKTLKK